MPNQYVKSCSNIFCGRQIGDFSNSKNVSDCDCACQVGFGNLSDGLFLFEARFDKTLINTVMRNIIRLFFLMVLTQFARSYSTYSWGARILCYLIKNCLIEHAWKSYLALRGHKYDLDFFFFFGWANSWSLHMSYFGNRWPDVSIFNFLMCSLLFPRYLSSVS